MSSKKSIICYADCDIDIGLGHINRLIAIYMNYHQKVNITFLKKNQLQDNIYNEFNCPTKDLSSLIESDILFDIGIYDSKKADNKIFLDIKQHAKKWICIDSTRSWTKHFDALVYPSFFVEEGDLPKEILKNKAKKFFGTDYILFKKTNENLKEYQINTLVTFGGSDPNNLTELVCSIVTNRKNHNDFSFLIGPKFKKNINYFSEKYPKLKFINHVKHTLPIISGSKIVVTANGITLQECEYLNKKTLILCNYKSDIIDINKIYKKSVNPEMYFNLGHFKEINESFFNNSYNFLSNKLLKFNPKNKKWGMGWDQFFDLK